MVRVPTTKEETLKKKSNSTPGAAKTGPASSVRRVLVLGPTGRRRMAWEASDGTLADTRAAAEDAQSLTAAALDAQAPTFQCLADEVAYIIKQHAKN